LHLDFSNPDIRLAVLSPGYVAEEPKQQVNHSNGNDAKDHAP